MKLSSQIFSVRCTSSWIINYGDTTQIHHFNKILYISISLSFFFFHSLCQRLLFISICLSVSRAVRCSFLHAQIRSAIEHRFHSNIYLEMIAWCIWNSKYELGWEKKKRNEEKTTELGHLKALRYIVFCLEKKKNRWLFNCSFMFHFGVLFNWFNLIQPIWQV